MPLFFTAVTFFIVIFFGSIALMLVLVARAIWKLDEEGFETDERPGLIQRIYEALWHPWA